MRGGPVWLWGPCGSQKQNLTHSGSASVACEESLSGKNEDINLSTRTGIFPIFKSITTKMMLDNLHTHVIVPDNQTPVEVLLIFNGGFIIGNDYVRM